VLLQVSQELFAAGVSHPLLQVPQELCAAGVSLVEEALDTLYLSVHTL
jgi:hypothetical protein